MKPYEYADSLIESISRADVYAAKSLMINAADLSPDEYQELDNTVKYFEDIGYSLERQARGYLEFLNDQREGYMFFKREKRYRYSTYKEAEARVYNAEYMVSNMIGLALAKKIEYIERMCARYYRTNVRKYVKAGGLYLEIGPGHGFDFEYNYRTLNQSAYTAVDVSEKSIALSKNLMDARCRDGAPYSFKKMDFFDLPENEQFDFIMMSEVLEHVERPADFLAKVRRLIAQEGILYAAVPMNSPLSDHIVLFTAPEDIIGMINDAGFSIIDFYEISCAAKYDIEKCHALQMPTMAAMFLRKTECNRR